MFIFVFAAWHVSAHGCQVPFHYRQIDPKRAILRQEHQRATKLFIGGAYLAVPRLNP